MLYCTITKIVERKCFFMATQQEVIKAFMNSLDKTTLQGTEAVDEAIKACSTFNSFKELKAALIKDCKNAKNADDFLKTYCGIDYSTDDSGAITGSDAGGSKVKNDASLIPESGSLKTYKKTSFTKKGLTVKLGDGKTYNGLTATEKFIWNGLYTWWIEGALNIIEESYGTNFGFGKDSSATTKELYVQFVNIDNDWRAYSWGTYNEQSGNATKLILSINMKYYKDIVKSNINEINSTFDILIAHELTHSVMSANVNLGKVFESLPAFINEGLAVLTTGASDYNVLKNLASDSSQFEKGLDVSKINVGVNDSHFPYEGGFIFFRYLARQAGDLTIENTKKSKVQTFYGNDYIKNKGKGSTIVSNSGSDTIKNYASNVSIDGGDNKDLISNSGGSKVTIIGGADNDTIWNWSEDGKVAVGASLSIAGGAGNDTIWNAGTYATIDGGAGNDTLENHAAKVSINGNAGNDRLYNYANNVTLIGGDNKDFLSNNGGNKVLIIGGAGNDTIWNWNTNVTIEGSTGNDTIANDFSKGKNVLFNYKSGDGNDLIEGFNTTSTLKIGNGKGTYSTTKKGKDIIVEVGNGKVTLQGAVNLSKVNIAGTKTSTLLTVTDKTKSPVTVGSAVKVINASKRTTAVKITGNSLANTITGGSNKDTIYGGNGHDSIWGGANNDKIYGQNGNDKLIGDAGHDSLWGGKGNDSLWGSDGKDTFIYADGDGNDVIYDFANADMLQITGKFSGTYNKSKKEVYFKVGSTKNAITLKNYSATTFNVNGTNYKISGSKLK